MIKKCIRIISITVAVTEIRRSFYQGVSACCGSSSHTSQSVFLHAHPFNIRKLRVKWAICPYWERQWYCLLSSVPRVFGGIEADGAGVAPKTTSNRTSSVHVIWLSGTASSLFSYMKGRLAPPTSVTRKIEECCSPGAPRSPHCDGSHLEGDRTRW